MKNSQIDRIGTPFRTILLVAVIVLGGSSFVFAQGNEETAQEVETVSRPKESHRLKIAYGHTTGSTYEGRSESGEISMDYFAINLDVIKFISEDTSILVGLSEKSMNLDLSGELPLPDELHSVGISLGKRRKLDQWLGPLWTGVLRLQSEFSTDTSSLSESMPSFMGVAFLSHQQSSTFSWDLGVIGRSRGEYPLLPLIGAKWNFASKWTASLGFPRTGLTYEFSEKVKLHGGIGFEGGLYHVSAERSPGQKDSWLEYTEVRVGISLECQINKHLTLQFEGGSVIDRDYDYYDQDYKIEGSSSSYFSLDLQTRF